MPRTRQGKIARLPRVIREVINHRLADGQTAAEILAWVNVQPKVRKILEQHFDGVDISPQNLSEWRGGGYLDWCEQREQEDQIRRLSELSYDLAKAGGTDLSAGALAIVSARIYDGLKLATGVDLDPDEDADQTGGPKIDLGALADAVAVIREVELKARTVSQRDKLVEIAERKMTAKEREIALAERRFQTLAVETFLKWAQSEEARKILDTGQPRHVKMERLREMMFGPLPPAPGKEGQAGEVTG